MKSRNSQTPLLRATPSPARPSPREQYPAQVSIRQPPHRAAVWVTEVTGVLFFGVNSSFSSVIRRKRRQKHAVQHCPRHNLFTWASMLISAILNVPLGALRQQQQRTRALWHRIGTFGGSWGAQDAKNTQYSTARGTISSHGPLCSYLPL